jgi:hypothetical protein
VTEQAIVLSVSSMCILAALQAHADTRGNGGWILTLPIVLLSCMISRMYVTGMDPATWTHLLVDLLVGIPVCVCETYIGKPISTRVVPQFTTNSCGVVWLVCAVPYNGDMNLADCKPLCYLYCFVILARMSAQL